MLCIQEDLPDVKYVSGKNKYDLSLDVTKQLPLYEISYIQEATHQVWAEFGKVYCHGKTTSAPAICLKEKVDVGF